jgi:cytochrome c
MKARRIRDLLMAIALLFPAAVVSLAFQAGGPDAGQGKELFSRRCSGCHSLDIDKEGPHLRGLLGRKAGSVPGFLYSDALRNSGILWNEDLLNQWLENPSALVRDNDMEFRVSSADERAALIAYLKSPGN